MSDQHSDPDMDLDLSPIETKYLDRSDSMRPVNGEELDTWKKEREGFQERIDDTEDHLESPRNVRDSVDGEDYECESRRTIMAAEDVDRWRREKDPQEHRNDNEENIEEDQIIRLPSEIGTAELEYTDMSFDQHYNLLSQTSILKTSADCLNFSQHERQLAYLKHTEIFENWKYSDEERAFLRHRVETFTREQCIIHCFLGHMLMTPDEMPGSRHTGLSPDEARQALLCLAIGSHWDVYNLAIIMAFSEKLSVDSSVNRMYQGGVDPEFVSSFEFRSRVTVYFARCLLDE